MLNAVLAALHLLNLGEEILFFVFCFFLERENLLMSY